MIQRFDRIFIHQMKRWAPITSRAALSILFIWFGALKVGGASPANGLVKELLAQTIPYISPDQFVIWFGVLEVCIGILFLIPRWGRAAILLLCLHMITTLMPLIMLPHITWIAPFVPTMEGQYIIKNFALIALGVGIIGTFHPMHSRR